MMRIPTPVTGTAELYRLVWSSAAGSRALFCLAIAVQSAGFLCTLASPLFLGLAVNSAQSSGGRDIGGIVGWLALMIATVIVAWAFNGPGRVLERRIALVVHTNLADRLVGNALDVDIRWHESRHSGDTTHRIRATVDAVTTFAESQFFYAKALLTFGGATVTLTVLSPPIGLAAFIGFGALAWVMVTMVGGLHDRLDVHTTAVARLSGALADTLGNIITVTALGAGPASRRHVRGTLDEVADAGRRIIVPMELKWWLITVGSGVLNASLLIGFAVIDWRSTGVVRVGFLVTISGYAAALQTAIEMLGGHWQQLLTLQAQARSADDLRAAGAASRVAQELPADWGRLTIRALELRHPGPDGGSVGARDLTLDRGERIALVGASGAGKSSLLRSLAGYYRCERFDLDVDEVPAAQARSLAGLTGLISQETEVFADSVRRNLDLGTGVDDLAIQRALHQVHLADVVAGLPDGLETDLDERGVNLSGGERQRLGLARGLLMTQDCSVLLLDEPTSSLDPVTEDAVLRNILAARPDATVIAAIHRLHLLAHFDRVVLMDNGRVIDAGTSSELVRRQPTFAALLRSAAAA